VKIWKKTIVLTVLGFLEVVFLSWALASNLPHRSADAKSLQSYLAAPTPEHYSLWVKEHQITLTEVKWRRYVGTTLAVGNLLLIGFLALKQAKPAIAGEPASGVTP
jgi:hypothetical protein